jgi:predicted phosphohydrolase
MSDTHELHRELDVPGGDLLIHAGDFSMFGRSIAAIQDFNNWLGEMPHRYWVVIAGNHEYPFEDPARRSLITNAKMLANEGIEILGLKIWGSPTTPLYGGAFGVCSEIDRVKIYSQIPADTDVLVTHGPPFGILDQAVASEHHSGCRQLLDAVLRVRPKLHVFGHVHGAYGVLHTPDTLYANVALLGLHGGIDRPPVTMRFPRV